MMLPASDPQTWESADTRGRFNSTWGPGRNVTFLPGGCPDRGTGGQKSWLCHVGETSLGTSYTCQAEMGPLKWRHLRASSQRGAPRVLDVMEGPMAYTRHDQETDVELTSDTGAPRQGAPPG